MRKRSPQGDAEQRGLGGGRCVCAPWRAGALAKARRGLGLGLGLG